LNILGNFPKFLVDILVTRDTFMLQILLISSFRMSETTSSMDSQLPETSKPLIPLPKATKKRRRELTNAQRAEIREFFFHDPSQKPSQKDIIQWFENEHYHTLTQGQVSKILSPQYSFLDSDEWLDRSRNRAAEYPDLEDALYHWERAANKSGRISVTGEILQQMAAKFWHKLPQYSSLDPPKFFTGWLAGFKARHNIKRRKKHGEAAEVDKMQMELDLAEIRDICDPYEMPDIFNMDETALNYTVGPVTEASRAEPTPYPRPHGALR
jgi:hypothetical protein